MHAMDPFDFDRLTVLGPAHRVRKGIESCDFLAPARKLEAAKTTGHLPDALLDAFFKTGSPINHWDLNRPESPKHGRCVL